MANVRTIVMGVLAVVAGALVLLVVFIAVSVKLRSEPGVAAPTRNAEPVVVDARVAPVVAVVDAPIAIDAAVHIVFDLHKVLGAKRAAAERVLGPSERTDDGYYSYAKFKPMLVLVLYDRGVAAEVSLVTSDFHFNDAEVKALLWSVGMERFDVTVDPDTKTWVEVWAPGMYERQRQRRAIARDLQAELRERFGAGIVSANGADLEFLVENCSPALISHAIAYVRDALVDLGFQMAECSGVENTVVKLQ